MKPTLYADDLWPASGRGSGLRAIKAARNSLVRILPRRCPDPQHTAEGWVFYTACPTCDGRGWLYPDPPEWWGDTWNWDITLYDVWRVMGIIE